MSPALYFLSTRYCCIIPMEVSSRELEMRILKSIAHKQNSGKVPGDIIIGETNNNGLTRELPKDSGKKCQSSERNFTDCRAAGAREAHSCCIWCCTVT